MPARRPICLKVGHRHPCITHELAIRAAIQTDRQTDKTCKSPARMYVPSMSWPFMCAPIQRQPAERSDEGDDEDCPSSDITNEVGSSSSVK
mmetsp:Transcript_51997/g.130661  ORF Transcript_51997/g.130661 Transcript_51997/m.130661 type:complete len:91 (-) Transcript_51997:794-1066(-)